MRNAKQNKLLIFIIALLMTCAFFLGGLLVVNSGNKQAVQAAAGDTTTVTLSVDKPSVPAGGTFVLTATITTTETAYWSNLDVFIVPLNASRAADTNIAQYLTADTENSDIGEFASLYTNSTVSEFDITSAALHLAVSSNSILESAVLPTSKPLVIKTPINVSSEIASAGISTINFGMRAIKKNKVVTRTDRANTYEYNGSAGKGLTANQVTVNIRSVSSDATLSGVRIGKAANSLTSLTLSDSMNWSAEIDGNSTIVVSPTAREASSTIRIGTTANPTATVTSGGNSTQTITNGRQTIYIKVTAEDGTTTKTYQIAVVNKYARLDAGSTRLDNTNSSVPFADMSNIGFASNNKQLNENSTAEQIINVPADATQITMRVRTKGGYGISDTLRIETTNCSADPSVTNASKAGGVTFDVYSVKNDSIVKVIATAADGATTMTYTFRLRTLSVDTAITEFYILGTGQGNRYDNVETQADGVNKFHFLLPAKSQYTGTMHITAANNSTITVNGSAYSSSTVYQTGSYSVVVTAPAGNSKTFPVVLVKEVIGGNFSKLEFSVDGTTWQDVFTSQDYDATNLTYNTKINLRNKAVGDKIYVRPTATEGSTVTSGGKLEPNSSKTVWSGVLAHGRNEFKLTASTEAGNTAYTFIVNLVEESNTITDIEMTSAGKPVPGFTFNRDVTNVNITVPYSTSSTTFRVTVDGKYTTVRTEREGLLTVVDGKHEVTRRIDVGSNVFKIHAVSDTDVRGTEYTITVTRTAASSDNALSSLSVTIGGQPVSFRDVNDEHDVTFSPDTTSYWIYSNSQSLTGEIVATAADSFATVTGDGQITLSDLSGSTSTVQQFTVTVTAQDGSTRQYKINIAAQKVELDSNFDIFDIRIENGGVTYLGKDNGETRFVSSNYNYSLSVPYGVDHVAVFVEASPFATVHGAGSVNLNEGLNTIEVYAVAQDESNLNGQIKYVINVTREARRDDVTLADISINGKTVDGFDKDVTDYTVRFDYNTENVNLRIVASDVSATIVLYRDGVVIAEGVHELRTEVDLGDMGTTLTVMINVALDGAVKPYSLRLIRAGQAPILTYLRVGSYQVTDVNGKPVDTDNPDPDGKTKEFFATIEHSDISLYIAARTDDQSAVLRIDKFESENGSGSGTFVTSDIFQNSLKATINIVIRPLSGSDSVYVLHLTRKPAPTSSTDVFIKVDNVKEFEYVNTNNVYGPYILDHKESILDMTVTPEKVDDLTAEGTYKVYYNGKLKNDNGTEVSTVGLDYGVNIVNVEILASDGYTSRTVSIVAVRGTVAFDRVDIDEIKEFHSDYKADVDEYFYAVENDITKLTISAELADGLTYQVENDKNLEVGLNTVYIKIYAIGNGPRAVIEPVKTVAVHVYRAEAQTMLWTILFFVFLGLAVVELFIIIFIPKRKNDNDTVIVAPAAAPAAAPAPQQPVQPIIVQQQPTQAQQQPVYVQQAGQQYVQNGKKPVNVEVKVVGPDGKDINYR